MAKITQSDFTYLKKKIYADRDYHEKQFLTRINPDTINAYFEGDPEKEYENEKRKVGRMTLNKLFPATSTLVTQLYPSNPKFIATARRPQDEFGSKIASGAMNYYYTQMKALTENQYAILSAWLYGTGIIKQGWRTVVKSPEKATIEPSNQTIGQKIANFFPAPNAEEDETPEYIESEGPFLTWVNSKNIYLDKDKPMSKGLFFTEKLCRTLYDIRESGLYNLDDDFYSRFKRSKDEREVEMTLYEQWIWQKDGMYVFVMCENYDKPLRYDKSPYVAEGFPYKVLNFVNEPDEIYPVSHMKVAQRQQRLTDYILTLQKEYIEKHKDVTIWDGDTFSPDDRVRILKNEIGTNVFTRDGKAPAYSAFGVQGNTIPKDLFNIQGLLTQNIAEILTVVGAKAGQSQEETLGQEKMVEYGNQLRSMGLSDKVREFLVAQGEKLLQDIKQFATAPTMFKITGMNVVNPDTGKLVTDEWIELGTDRSPQTLREVVPKQLDLDIDVSEFARRDIAVVRKQMMEVLQMLQGLAPALAAEGKRVKLVELTKDLLKNFETISNADKYFEDLPAPAGMPIGTEGPMPGAPLPGPMPGGLTPEGITQGANVIPPPGV